ncbi:hypothetical protein [Phaeocystidibacter luteus]|uniref:Uncharacterized protein n=1 Tax=Phaeocystidibacter luteus TaxID=911197 RepID=A0A6N6RIJ8_9FLAO|nr:hypothetical protein [Phaeocystidibacter luteus]KAB2810244.1 hypothetical protein F8C67_06580 [Phaeocystidibacter luteus]
MVRFIWKQGFALKKVEILLLLFVFPHIAAFSQQYHNPWNIDVGIDVGPSSLVLNEQLPSESEFLQSPFHVPYDTSKFLFNHEYRGIWIRSQGRVDVTMNLQFSHEDGYMFGLGFRTGLVPAEEPRVYYATLSSDESASRSVELSLNSLQIQGGWDLFHERWNIPKSHLFRLNCYLGYSWMSMDDLYTYHYSETNSSGSMLVNSSESFTLKAGGVNWGCGMDYIWFPNKIKSGFGLGFTFRFDRHYLNYREMNRNTYFLNGEDQLKDLAAKERVFLFEQTDSGESKGATRFDKAISHSDNVHFGLKVLYRFGRL